MKMKLRFLGFDTQTARPVAQFLLAYLKRVAPEYAPTAQNAIKHLYPVSHKWAYQIYPKRPAAVKQQARERLFSLLGFIAHHRMRFTRLSSAAEFEKALYYARLLLNIDAIRNVSEDLREPYYVLGFAFDHGSFQAGDEDAEAAGRPFTGLTEFTLGPSPAGSLGWHLSRPGVGNYIIDLRSAPTSGAVAVWLNSLQPVRVVGGGFSSKWEERQYTEPISLKDHFDSLIFIEKTTRARPLPYNPMVRPFEG